LPPGFDEFAQALKETNAAKAWLTNPALLKAMEKPGKISTPKPIDESGFQEASLDHSFYETPRRMTLKQARKAEASLDESFFGTPKRMTPKQARKAKRPQMSRNHGSLSQVSEGKQDLTASVLRPQDRIRRGTDFVSSSEKT
jgi:hypothetical protein